MSALGLAERLADQRQIESQPLNEREIKLIARLLSDPSVFPREFRNWITEHASDSVDISKSQVHGLINSQGQIVFTAASWEQLGIALTGLILPWIATVKPAANWLRCDGTYYGEADYPALFALIGHGFDPVASTGQFAVPDLRGRPIYGYDENGQAGGGPFAFTQNEGAATGGRGPGHHHTMGNHTHGMSHAHSLSTNLGAIGPGGAGYADGGGAGGGSTGGPSFTTTSGPNNDNTSGPPPLNGGAYLALNYYIASGKVPT